MPPCLGDSCHCDCSYRERRRLVLSWVPLHSAYRVDHHFHVWATSVEFPARILRTLFSVFNFCSNACGDRRMPVIPHTAGEETRFHCAGRHFICHTVQLHF